MTRKYISALVPLLLVFMVTAPALAHESTSNDNKIIVSGVGEVEAQPDIAILRVSVYAQRANLDAAKQQADAKYRRVLEVLEKYKVDDKHIKAMHISAQPEYEWSDRKRVFKGHRVSRSLQITLVDMDSLPEVMQALVANDVSTIDGVSVDVSDRERFTLQAMGLAADDARAKAAFLANRLGRELGQVVFISETGNQASRMPQPEVRMMKAMAADSEPAPQEHFGTEKIKVRLTAHFALL